MHSLERKQSNLIIWMESKHDLSTNTGTWINIKICLWRHRKVREMQVHDFVNGYPLRVAHIMFHKWFDEFSVSTSCLGFCCIFDSNGSKRNEPRICKNFRSNNRIFDGGAFLNIIKCLINIVHCTKICNGWITPPIRLSDAWRL